MLMDLTVSIQENITSGHITGILSITNTSLFGYETNSIINNTIFEISISNTSSVTVGVINLETTYTVSEIVSATGIQNTANVIINLKC